LRHLRAVLFFPVEAPVSAYWPSPLLFLVWEVALSPQRLVPRLSRPYNVDVIGA